MDQGVRCYQGRDIGFLLERTFHIFNARLSKIWGTNMLHTSVEGSCKSDSSINWMSKFGVDGLGRGKPGLVGIREKRSVIWMK